MKHGTVKDKDKKVQTFTEDVVMRFNKAMSGLVKNGSNLCYDSGRERDGAVASYVYARHRGMHTEVELRVYPPKSYNTDKLIITRAVIK